MIKFFRKIRNRLINQNRLGKYMVYAAGEIILVVIGILIALAINNANEDRKIRKLAMTFVDQMIDDLKADTLDLATNIQITQKKAAQCKYFMSFFEGNAETISPEQFVVDLQYSGRIYLPKRAENTYRDMIGTGALKLLKDFGVIDEIRSYYSTNNSGWFEQYRDRVLSQYLPIIVDAVPFQIHEEIIDKEFEINAADITIDPVDPDVFSLMVDKLENDPKFDFNLRNAARAHLVHSKVMYEMKLEALTLLQALEEFQSQSTDI